MKKLLIALLALTMVFTFAACGGGSGEGGSGGSSGYSWPAADYMPDGVEYTGGGEIVVVVEDTNGHMIYINGVSKADFDAYVAQLESAGVTGKVTEYDRGGYSYGGESDGFYANLTFYSEEPSSTMDEVDGEIVDVEYNLLISTGAK